MCFLGIINFPETFIIDVLSIIFIITTLTTYVFVKLIVFFVLHII